MTAPAPATISRPARRGPKLIEELGGPDLTYPAPPGTWRQIPIGDTCPKRRHWLELLLRNPAAARREALEARLQYWRARLEKLQARLQRAEEALAAARCGLEDDGSPAPPVPEAVMFQLGVDRAVAWADLRYAKARLSELERALAQ